MGVQSMRDLIRRESPVRIYELEQYFERMLTGAVCLIVDRPAHIQKRITFCLSQRYMEEDTSYCCELHRDHSGRHRCTTDYVTLEWD